MISETKQPATLTEAIVFFNDEENCISLLIAKRWPNGVTCPRCEHDKVTRRTGRAVWLCNGCRKEFTLKVGTFMEDSPLKLGKWLTAMWMIANCKNGVSSYEIHRAVGVTQKSAWFMLHRIRLAFTDQPTDLSGTVEADETYIGGLEKNKHKNLKRKAGRGTVGKVPVMALMERGGKARVKKIANTSRKTLHGEITKNVKAGSNLHTDALPSYKGLPAEYVHAFVDHAVEYVREGVHTNSLENFFSLLKRMIRGTYVSVDADHLHSYLDEQTFRFNERHSNDGERFQKLIGDIHGKRLTFKQLVGARPIF